MRAVANLRVRVILCAWVGTVFSFGQAARAEEPHFRIATEQVSAALDLSKAFRSAANRASPGLVTVYSMRGPRMTAQWRQREASRHGYFASNDDRQPGPWSSESHTDDQGSGVVIDSKGIILTCNHLVASADALLVVLPDGRSFEPVEVLGDSITDVAMVRIEGAGELEQVSLGNSDDLQVGDWVVTLANPYELGHSLSAGVVSASNRWISGAHHPLIQYDASTNPGSSGGALLNLKGEVVGIITGSYGQTDTFQGIGLALPVNTATRVVAEMQVPGQVQHAYLGCQTKALSPAVAEQLGLPVKGGLYVEDVEDSSPAARAGIREGDVITHFGDQVVDDNFNHQQFANSVPGETYSFTLFRSGDSVGVDVQMKRIPEVNPVAESKQGPPKGNFAYFDEQLGLGFDNLTANVAYELGFPPGIKGALVSHVTTGGSAYKEGIAAGMVVVRVNDYAISDLNRYKQAASSRMPDKPFLMLVQTNEGKHLVVFEKP